jgi:ABC-2 type transport system ATP-binding protein
MTMIEVSHLNKSYGTKRVLNDLSLTFESGQIVGLLGPNGCGKTTLLKILAGLISDYQGQVRLGGQPVGIQTKAMVSFLPERTYLSGWMRPVDTFDFFTDFYTDFDRRKAEEMLQRFRLEANQPIRTMSKGMQEKLQLVLVMARNAKIYLLDEPLGGVDPAARSAILNLVLENYQTDAVMLLATHMIQDVEPIFDRAVLLGFGELILNEPTDAIRQRYGQSVDEVFREVFKCSLSL